MGSGAVLNTSAGNSIRFATTNRGTAGFCHCHNDLPFGVRRRGRYRDVGNSDLRIA